MEGEVFLELLADKGGLITIESIGESVVGDNVAIGHLEFVANFVIVDVDTEGWKINFAPEEISDIFQSGVFGREFLNELLDVLIIGLGPLAEALFHTVGDVLQSG